ncbi:ethanolamine ammonia-lyase reactivating factor EutA [Blautia sp. MSJ-19]|uniref:ethanolamine ammonia-lyase reactivating factor EutA n=1 Tax=Blautia sp. MSJ-19 TaxID=2841517 RepID=UPI001C0EBDCF|nr:ethanolamine ammonia-lyase reactivating factor EutA [Blautia sp. MSJ-19]MBU5482562.1 ethanolamine ammonia-lyase reactivating factor EutA [Blautia sp. MSJ-19]
MQTEEILSAGIDIGTSTTQLVFSRMVLQNTGGFGKIPQIRVVSKEVIYRSQVYFTPLLSREEIDGKWVDQIIKKEYRKAGIKPTDLSTGAVIITGETSRKKNAEDVVEAIADVAGDFVMATAGADLESVLAGKGAGAAELSRKTEKVVANLDIGGGTTNICLFENGNVLDTACFDIGGRLVKISDGKITYIAPKISWLSEKLGLEITEGQKADVQKLKILTDAMAEILAKAMGLEDKEEGSSDIDRANVYIEKMKTNHGITCEKRPELFTFSGGVASCFEEIGDIFRYGDIGVLLAQSILESDFFQQGNVRKAKETMRATVIGAGNYSMNISGSTIEYTEDTFPLKNIPVVKLNLEQETDITDLDEKLHRAMQIYHESRGEGRQIALAMKGLKCPTFAQIQEIAEKLAAQYEKENSPDNALIIVLEEDIGKALGQALHHRIKNRRKIICIDGIYCESGDFIDLGEPIVSGKVIPVIVKTLIFNG